MTLPSFVTADRSYARCHKSCTSLKQLVTYRMTSQTSSRATTAENSIWPSKSSAGSTHKVSHMNIHAISSSSLVYSNLKLMQRRGISMMTMNSDLFPLLPGLALHISKHLFLRQHYHTLNPHSLNILLSSGDIILSLWNSTCGS